MAIIGVDNRELVTDTSSMPYSAIVQIIAYFPDGNSFLGSGFLIGENDVLTAAHVLYDDDHGGLATEVIVTPGLDGDTKPFGEIHAVELAVPEGWKDSEDNDYDYAVIGLESAAGYGAGWFTYSSLPDAQFADLLYTAGYPGDHGGENQYLSSGTVDYTYSNIYYFDDDLDLIPGQSGGPLFSSDNDAYNVVGVVSHYTLQPLSNGVLALGPDNIPEIDNWVEGNNVHQQPMLADTDLYDFDDIGFMTRIFTSLLDRMPQEDGLRFWLDSMNNGMEMKSICSFFLSSHEYVTGGGTTEPYSFMTFIADTVLERSLEPSGFEWWVEQMDNGMSVDDVTLFFVNSTEYRQKSAAKEHEIRYLWFDSYVVDSEGSLVDEIIFGSAWSDNLKGAAGDDQLYGGTGSDWLDAGSGDDIMSGGDGGDFFVVDINDQGHDLIIDFSIEEDFLLTDGEQINYTVSENSQGDGLLLTCDPGEGSLTLTGLSLDDWSAIMFT